MQAKGTREFTPNTGHPLYIKGYRRGMKDARLGQYIPEHQHRHSENYQAGYAQSRTDFHEIAPAPLGDRAPHLRVVVGFPSEPE